MNLRPEIICGQCPAVYRADEIDAYLKEERVSTLADLRGTSNDQVEEPAQDPAVPDKALDSPARPVRAKRFGRKLLGMRTMPEAGVAEVPVTPSISNDEEPEFPDLESLPRLRAYTFRCPEGHVVDGNAGAQLGLAVLGASGASKTHILPALVRELHHTGALRSIGISLRDPLYPNYQLAQDIFDVYNRWRQLAPTDPGAVIGPYGYRLQIRSNASQDPVRYSLLLYDVAGEDLENTAQIVERAPFMVLCKAIIILIDPVEFLPTLFDETLDEKSDRIDVARDIRSGISVIADTLAEVWRVRSPKQLRVPICFAIAKSDSVVWGGRFDWELQTTQVLAAASEGPEALRAALRESSESARQALLDLGGELVVDEIDEHFSRDWIRYSAASATMSMPRASTDGDERQWEQKPEPKGAALSLLQLLDLKGALVDMKVRGRSESDQHGANPH